MRYSHRKKYTLNDIINGTCPNSKSLEPDTVNSVIRSRRSETSQNNFHRSTNNSPTTSSDFDHPYNNKNANISDSSLLLESEKPSTLTSSSTSSSSIQGKNAQYVPDLPMLKSANAALIVDTNFILTHLDMVDQLKDLAEKFNHIVVIPWIVIQELDNLKSSSRKNTDCDDKNSLQTIGFLARKATEWIYNILAVRDSRVIGQKINQRLDSTLEGDDSILDCCLYFQEEYLLLTVILSNDRNLCNKSLLHNIKTVTYRKELSATEIAKVVSHEVPAWQEQVNNQQIVIEEKRKQKEIANKALEDALNKQQQHDLNDQEEIVMEDVIYSHNDSVISTPSISNQHDDDNNTHISKFFNHSNNGINININTQNQQQQSMLSQSQSQPNIPVIQNFSQNAVINMSMIKLQQNLIPIVFSKNLVQLHEMVISTILDEVSPVVCKTIFSEISDTRTLEQYLGTTSLNRIFISQDNPSLSTQSFYGKRNEFIINPHTTYKLHTVNSMIPIIETFFQPVFSKYLKCSKYSFASIQNSPYSEPNPNFDKILQEREIQLTPTSTSLKKTILSYHSEIHNFITLWTNLWKTLEINQVKLKESSVATEITSSKKSNDNNNNENTASMIRDIEEYIHLTVMILNEAVDEVLLLKS